MDKLSQMRLCLPYAAFEAASDDLLLVRVVNGVWDLVPCTVGDEVVSIVLGGTGVAGLRALEICAYGYREQSLPEKVVQNTIQTRF